LDRVNECKTKRARERQNAEELRRQKSQQEVEASTSQAIVESSSSASDDSNEEQCTSTTQKSETTVVGASAAKKPKMNILTPSLPWQPLTEQKQRPEMLHIYCVKQLQLWDTSIL